MQFRFSSGDLINGSVVEAGIDDFRIQELVCGVNEDPAEVTASPQSQSVCEGDDVVFSVSASGAQPLTFQWRLNGGNIGGATSSVLNIQDVVPGDAGSYTCVVSNGFGSDESASATLSVTSLASCDDGNACTVDSCAAAACSSIDNTPAGECCDPATGDLTTIDDGNDCSTDICDPGTGDVTYSINVPAIVGAGGRSLNVTPDIACGDPIALVISSVELPCFEFYVAADGSLTGAPVFQTAATWSTVTISSEEIIPGTSYSVQSEVPGGTRSVVASGETWAWGDVDQNTVANFADVQLVVLGFQNDFSLVTVAAADLDPCMPNGIINFGDILRAVSAFQGQTYLDSGCPIPCD